MTFANLTRKATIEIYNLRGLRVQVLNIDTWDGGYLWNLRDENGRRLPAGIYLYRVFNERESHWGKFAVVR